MEARLQQALDRRRSEGTLRCLSSLEELQKQRQDAIDFSSNDYLGLACSKTLRALVDTAFQQAACTCFSRNVLGATGSRLLSGDSVYSRKLEEWLACLHCRPAALLCNSGYDANLSITSCLPVDVIVMDELCHNSIYMGVKWNASRRHDAPTVVTTFAHNNVHDLTAKLQQQHSGNIILVLVESVYSMDGDVAPLQEILNVSQKFGAHVVVDEAHGLGIFGHTNRRDLSMLEDDDSESTTPTSASGGTGVLAALQLEQHPSLLASVYTFGKAAGCHGAVICCSSPTLKEYLLNYARPFIYSTALPLHSLVTIQCSYQTFTSFEGETRRRRVFELVRLFRERVESMLMSIQKDDDDICLCPSNSPIQALLIPGNAACMDFCRIIKDQHGILLYPIRAPTVPKGQERVRIILHAHNTSEEVEHLVECMNKTLQQQQVDRYKMNSRL
jgi:8-amino-7-oxononanoate synthase